MPAFALLSSLSVASLNLCTDEYLLLLARPQEIASVSFLSHDPQESPLWRLARRHPANLGSLEGAIGNRPRVVLTMGGGGRATSLIARRLGVRAVELRSTVTLDDVAANLTSVASVLGEPKRATPWLERLASLRASAPRKALDAIWLSGGGQSLSVPSAGAEWMRLAGLKQRALHGGRATLETLLASPPTVLLQSRYRSRQMSSGATWLNHPIVRNARSRRLETDGRAWTCMGPLLIPEAERLRAELK